MFRPSNDPRGVPSAASPGEGDDGPALVPMPIIALGDDGAFDAGPATPRRARQAAPTLQALSVPVIEVGGSAGLVCVGDGVTDVGRQREHNEDQILIREDLGLFAVCDGMGGHQAGEVASALAATVIEGFFERHALTAFFEGDHDDLLAGARRLTRAVTSANAEVHTVSRSRAEHRGMGTTVVAAYVQPGVETVHVAHLGDSRCYRLRAGKLEQLTRDHSLINELSDLKGVLGERELARLPRNVVTRALGLDEGVKVDVRSDDLADGDVFLLCSDGLTGMVSDDEIAEVLGFTPDAREAAELLVAMANEAGGTDNVSVVVFRVEG